MKDHQVVECDFFYSQLWHTRLSGRMTFDHPNNMILIIINASQLSTEFGNKSTTSVPRLFFSVRIDYVQVGCVCACVSVCAFHFGTMSDSMDVAFASHEV